MEYEFYEIRKSDAGTEDFLIEAGQAKDKEEALCLFVDTLNTENDLETYDELRRQNSILEVSYVLKDCKTKEVLMTIELSGRDLVNAKTGEVL